MAVKNPLSLSVSRKIYKTGQTRGADDDVIFQNRVGRNSTVLIPFRDFDVCSKAPSKDGRFENGYIVLIKPEDFFDAEINKKLGPLNLRLGENLLVFYETRKQWIEYPPLPEWSIPNSRINPLGGEYVARVPGTTSSSDNEKIVQGYNSSNLKGAGIRVYEYADTTTINACKIQLEYVFWQCSDIKQFIETSNNSKELLKRKEAIEAIARKSGLADTNSLIRARILNREGFTICPLCLKKISSLSFGDKMQQAVGRDVPDLTVTEVSLFHIRELRTGEFNHRPYNLGWGHHHCNVVVKDSGISETIQWMRNVINDNDNYYSK